MLVPAGRWVWLNRVFPFRKEPPDPNAPLPPLPLHLHPPPPPKRAPADEKPERSGSDEFCRAACRRWRTRPSLTGVCLWQQEGVTIQTFIAEEENSRSLEEGQVRLLEANLFCFILEETRPKLSGLNLDTVPVKRYSFDVGNGDSCQQRLEDLRTITEKWEKQPSRAEPSSSRLSWSENVICSCFCGRRDSSSGRGSAKPSDDAQKRDR